MSAPSKQPPPRPPERRTSTPTVQRKPAPSERRQSLGGENEASASSARRSLGNRTYETVDGLDFERFKISEANENAAVGVGGTSASYETESATSQSVVTETEPALPRIETAIKDISREIESAVAPISEATTKTTAKKATSETATIESLNAVDELEEEYRAFQIAEIDHGIAENDFDGAYGFIKEFLSSPGVKDKDVLIMDWSRKMLSAGQFKHAAGLMGKVERETMTADQQVDCFFLVAEVYIGREKLDSAEYYCLQGINLRKATPVTGETRATMNDFMDQMARILDGRGNKMKARFFRSKVPFGYKGLMSNPVSPAAPASKSPVNVEAELPKVQLPAAIEKAEASAEVKELIDRANVVLKDFGITCGLEGRLFRLNGTDDEVLGAFEQGLKEENFNLLGIMLTDKTIINRCTLGSGWSALDIAVSKDNEKMVNRLLEIGAWTQGKHSPREDGVTVIMLAARYAGSEVTKALLAKEGAIAAMFTRSDTGYMPMHQAARCRNLPFLNTVLLFFREHQASKQSLLLNAKTSNGGLTPLMIAADRNINTEKYSSFPEVLKNMRDPKKAAECVRWFCEKNPTTVNKANHYGLSALHFAVKAGLYDNVRVLLECGANPFMRTKMGESPLDMARAYGHSGIDGMLLDYRINVWPSHGVQADGLKFKTVLWRNSSPNNPHTNLNPSQNDIVQVHYVGMLENGKEFSNSRKEGGGPFEFRLGTGSVIQGWEIAITHVNLGSTAVIVVPPQLGYGSRGIPTSGIPGDATLVFEVELLKINEFEAYTMEEQEPASLA